MEIKFEVMPEGKTSLKFTYEIMVYELLVNTEEYDL